MLKVKGLTEVSLMKQSESESNISNIDGNNDNKADANEEDEVKEVSDDQPAPQKQLKSNTNL